MRILLTGATGFVGRPTAAALKSAGHEVIAAVRNLNDLSLPDADQLVSVGDLATTIDWGPALKGVDCVVHLAGLSQKPNLPQEEALRLLHLVNVSTTEALAEAAKKSGVKRFVFVSSVKVHGETTFSEPFTETSPFQASDAYARSKLAAERILLEKQSETFQICIVRPPLVYGPGVRGNMRQLIKLVERGVPLPIANIKNARDMCAVENLADLLATCCIHPNAAGQAFLVCDGEPMSTSTMTQLIGVEIGQPVRFLPCPQPILWLLTKALGKSAIYDRIAGDLQIDDGFTMRHLSWQKPLTTGTAVSQMIERYKMESS